MELSQCTHRSQREASREDADYQKSCGLDHLAVEVGAAENGNATGKDLLRRSGVLARSRSAASVQAGNHSGVVVLCDAHLLTPPTRLLLQVRPAVARSTHLDVVHQSRSATCGSNAARRCVPRARGRTQSRRASVVPSPVQLWVRHCRRTARKHMVRQFLRLSAMPKLDPRPTQGSDRRRRRWFSHAVSR